ncbi:MAG: excisionase family DNA-binding protein [Gammaproteobacteria bacterium]|nr:excisionase family DNA-binding protein [Gammaproteobacteria bacterium]
MDIRVKGEKMGFPSDRDAALAARTSRKLAALLNSAEPVPARFGAANAESVEIPAPAIRLLGEILDQMAHGIGVTLVPLHAELTTRQGAELLCVPQPHLEKLLDDRRIPCRITGTHRCVRAKDLLAYRRKTESLRREALDRMTTYDQELGLQ